jgi:hypothetical protein
VAGLKFPPNSFLQITGQRRNDFHLVRGQMAGQPPVSRRFDDRQVAAVNDMATIVARRLDQITKVFTQFGRAARDIHNLGAVRVNPFPDPPRGFSTDHLRPPRRGFDVAVPASLVALASDIDLKCFKPCACQGLVICRKFLLKQVHRREHGGPCL